MPEQPPYRRQYEPDPLPFTVDEWDERDNHSRCLGKACSIKLASALYWAAVATLEGKARLTLRHGIRLMEQNYPRKPVS